MIRNKLKETNGNIIMAYAFTLLGFALLLSIGLQVAYVWNTVNVIKGKTNEAVLAVAASNVGNIYNGVRESTGQARSLDPAATTWEYLVASDEVLDVLINNLKLSERGSSLHPDTSQGSKHIYTIHDFKVTYRNEESGLHFITTYRLSIPLKLGADLLPPIDIPMKVDSTYEPKF